MGARKFLKTKDERKKAREFSSNRDGSIFERHICARAKKRERERERERDVRREMTGRQGKMKMQEKSAREI